MGELIQKVRAHNKDGYIYEVDIAYSSRDL
jgi:hypothetical protein